MRTRNTTAAAASDEAAILTLFERLALEAGRVILSIYDAGVAFETKPDASPVTEADRAAEKVILSGLRENLPALVCVAEEECAAGSFPALQSNTFLLVDPLDGTREFIQRRPEFTVNIALVRDGDPEIGVVYAPALGELYSGRPGIATEMDVTSDFRARNRRAIEVRPAGTPLSILASRSHRTAETDAYLEKFPDAEVMTVGSSLKFCLLATGRADLYPRFGRTMEWDTAAGDAVLRAAGGSTRLVDGGPLIYGKRKAGAEADFVNPWFIAEGGGVS